MTVTRRAVLSAATLTALGCLAACSGSPGAQRPGATSSSDAAHLAELAASLVSDMVTGTYASTIALEDDTMKDALDETGLRTAWEQATAGKGDFLRIHGTATSEVDGSTVVLVVAAFTGGHVTAQYSFDAHEQVNGLYLRDSTAADLASVGAATAAGSAAAVVTGTHGTDHPVQVGTYQLDGTLVTPAEGTAAREVVALLVAGSGPQDMDETIGKAGNKPLRDLADALAGLGISSLRYNKRYQQRPDTAGDHWTLDSEVLEDVTAAIALLRSRAEVEGYAIVVAGHSLGGMLLPRILAADTTLAGGISLAGSPRHFLDIVYDQKAAQLTASGVSQAEKDTQLATLRTQIDEAKALTDPQAEPVLDMPASYVVSLNELHASLPEDVATATVPWLVLQGGDDAQVYPDTDYPAWSEVLSGKDTQYQLFDGLNHLFMPTSQTDGPLDYDTANTVSSEVSQAIATWVGASVR